MESFSIFLNMDLVNLGTGCKGGVFDELPLGKD